MEASHRAFLERCLKLGICNQHFSKTLERSQLDDPRVSEEERERRLQKWLHERRRKGNPLWLRRKTGLDSGPDDGSPQ